MTSNEARDVLRRALEEAARALEREDALAACSAMERVGACCRDAQAHMLQLSPVALEELRSLHARCCRAAEATRATIGASLLQLAAFRRAADAYKGR